MLYARSDGYAFVIHFNFPPFLARWRSNGYFHGIPEGKAWLIVIALMFPASLMPMASSVLRVSSPLFREAFGLTSESVAWLSMSFSIPFMVLTPVYCRLSEIVGRRRLIMAGCALFLVGVLTSMLSPRFSVLLLGQGIQGFGVAGMTPLGMAYISAIFPRHERGKALGTWSSVGPTVAFLGPLMAGLILSFWSWRFTFLLSLIVGILALAVVIITIPAGYSNIKPEMWRRFDWMGVLFLACSVVTFFAFLSSRPITGVPPLQDWRLALLVIFFLSLLFWREKTATSPFIELDLYRIKSFRLASFGAAFRMITMGCTGLLMPLYLADLHDLQGAALGVMLMVNPAAMSLMVRFGGLIADRWGIRRPLLIGFSSQALVLLVLFQLPAAVPLWVLGSVLAIHGLGVGTMLAALHRTALLDVKEDQANIAAGMYSLTRFAGVAIGTTTAGVLYQQFSTWGFPVLQAYQITFLCFIAAVVVGLVFSLIMIKGDKQTGRA